MSYEIDLFYWSGAVIINLILLYLVLYLILRVYWMIFDAYIKSTVSWKIYIKALQIEINNPTEITEIAEKHKIEEGKI